VRCPVPHRAAISSSSARATRHSLHARWAVSLTTKSRLIAPRGGERSVAPLAAIDRCTAARFAPQSMGDSAGFSASDTAAIGRPYYSANKSKIFAAARKLREPGISGIGALLRI
jgi:hypothetical protein